MTVAVAEQEKTKVADAVLAVSDEKTPSDKKFDDYKLPLPTAMGSYLNRIGQVELLTVEKEIQLARLARAGDEKAKRELVEANLKLVVSVAKYYRRAGMSLSDLVQEGNFGLFTAIEAFDPELGYRFSTYAVGWIRQAITRAIEKQGRTIRIPSYIIQAERNWRKNLGSEYDLLSIQEIAKKMGIDDENKVRHIVESAKPIISLNDEETPDGIRTIIETIEALEPSPEEELLEQERSDIIVKLLGVLNPKERFIVKKRLGLEDGIAHTLQEVGAMLHVTRERIRQLEARAYKKLRTASSCSKVWEYFNTEMA